MWHKTNIYRPRKALPILIQMNQTLSLLLIKNINNYSTNSIIIRDSVVKGECCSDSAETALVITNLWIEFLSLGSDMNLKNYW